MLKVLDNESSIRGAQQRFAEAFEHFGYEKIPVRLGHRGDSFTVEVLWSSELNIWIYSEIVPGSRYWNAFGIGEPREGGNTSITCEINFPLKGIDRRIAGAFVVDSLGAVYVVHRGKIGGGRRSIGKSLFEENYRGEWIDIKDGEVENAVALIGALDSPRFARQVGLLVLEVDRIKGLATSPIPSPIVPPSGDHEFREEFTGKKRYKGEKEIEAQCDHGLVVNTLASALESLGLMVANDRRDLYVVDSLGRIKALFEIKTSASTSSLYSAVGQLMLYSVDLPERPRLILTVPEGVSTAIEGKLNRLGIEVLTYGWSDNEVVFEGLDSLGL